MYWLLFVQKLALINQPTWSEQRGGDLGSEPLSSNPSPSAPTSNKTLEKLLHPFKFNSEQSADKADLVSNSHFCALPAEPLSRGLLEKTHFPETKNLLFFIIYILIQYFFFDKRWSFKVPVSTQILSFTPAQLSLSTCFSTRCILREWKELTRCSLLRRQLWTGVGSSLSNSHACSCGCSGCLEEARLTSESWGSCFKKWQKEIWRKSSHFHFSFVQFWLKFPQ